MRNTVSQWIYSNSKISIGLILIVCISLISCLSYTEKKTVIEKSVIGEPAPILEFQSSTPEIKANLLILPFQQKNITKFSTKVNVTTEIERNSKNEYCSHRKSSSEDYDPDVKIKCEYGKYKSNLVEAGVLSFGLMIPIILFFDWTAYPFITGASEKHEESSEAKFNPTCIKGSAIESGRNVYLEYTVFAPWENSQKVPIKNCVAQIPITSDFNKSSALDYRILIDDKEYYTGRFSYHSNGNMFKGDSATFKAIRKNADKLEERVRRNERLAQEVSEKVAEANNKREVKSCEKFLSNLAYYLDLKNPGTNRNTSCLFTCRNYAVTTKTWDSYYPCQSRCNQCWSMLRWDDSWGAESSSEQMKNTLDYESLRRPNSY